MPWEAKSGHLEYIQNSNCNQLTASLISAEISDLTVTALTVTFCYEANSIPTLSFGV